MPEPAAIQPFVFPATRQPIRTVVVDGEPLVCHTDVCKILDHSNPSVAIRLVDDDEKLLIDTDESDIDALNRDTPGNAQDDPTSEFALAAARALLGAAGGGS